ncbi:hypothetical protein M0802_016364 [Mischocyttarus mexicanus]|nr:hypothetical protein M0802_016364 [Mischocyttarus mexicanus]
MQQGRFSLKDDKGATNILGAATTATAAAAASTAAAAATAIFLPIVCKIFI